MIKGHCTNPGCHRPYIGGNYAEVVTLRELRSGELNYFVISICTRCLNSANNILIEAALRDAVNYEIAENAASLVIPREQKQQFRIDQERYKFLGWGRNRDELDQKVFKQ